MKKALLLLVLQILSLSCKTKSSFLDVDCPVINPLTSTVAITDIKDFIRNAQVVPLNTMGNAKDLSARKMLVLQNSDFILLCGSGVHRFTKDGDYVSSYGRIGRGPGEYIKIGDICLNENQTQLFALDHMNNLMKFDISNGAYIGTVDTKSPGNDYPPANAVLPGVDDRFYYYVANNHSPQIKKDGSDFYCLWEFNKKGKLIGKSIPWTDFNVDFPYTSFVTLNYDNTYIIRPQENSNVCYEVRDGKVSTLYKIHFGDENIKPHFAFKDKMSPWDNLGDIMPSDSYKMSMCMHMTKDHFYFCAVGPNSEQYNFLLDRETLQGIRWKHSGDSMPFFIIGADEEYFYGLFDFYGDVQFDKNDPLMKYLVSDMGVTLNDNDNPTLIKISFNNLKQTRL